MKKYRAVLAVLVCVALVLLAYSFSKRAYVQHLQRAHITVKAQHMKRSVVNESSSKENSDNIDDVVYYKASSGKIQYVVTYSQNKSDLNLLMAANSIKKMFRDYDFQFTITENPVAGFDSLLLDGTFKKDGKDFALKELLIKNEKEFWQALAIYPSSEKNAEKADKFIKSVIVDTTTK